MTKLLLIDDEPRVARALEYAMNGRGVDLRATRNSTAAMAAATHDVPDAILLDVNLGGEDGLELCRALKSDERTRHVPVLLLSGNVDEATKAAGFAAGADDFIAKPFVAGDLLARVAAQLERVRR